MYRRTEMYQKFSEAFLRKSISEAKGLEELFFGLSSKVYRY